MLSSRECVPPISVPFASIALFLLLLAGCDGGEGIVLPDEGEPDAIAVVEGDEQRGRVGEPLSDPLVVLVTDSRGRPVRGATVAFDLSSAGAGAAVVPQEKTTNGDGLADARLVLGTRVGRQTGQARVVLEEDREPIQAAFSAIALPENANGMAAVAGQDQTGHVGLPLDDRLVVEVTDGFGNPVAGVPISWAAAGGGSVSEAVVETDEDGRSRVDRVLGPTVGQQSTVASSEGLAGSPVTFLHTALAGDASRLVIISGNDQTAEVGSVLPGELVAQLIDADGNGVPQTAVSWVVATGGGAATPEITTTDGDGRTSAQWTLGGTLGPQRLDAVVSGVGIASFRATATAGTPASLFILTQPPASASNGVPLTRQPVLQLRDSQGNDVAQAGVLITVAIGSGGGELGGTGQVSTDASGQATFTDLSISGAPGPRPLVFTAEGYAQVTSTEIDLQAIGTTTAITGDSPDPSGVGAAFTVSFRVASQGPIPTGSVTVGDGFQSCSGALASGAGTCQLALTTVGVRTLTATYAGVPGLLGSSDTEPHTVTAAPPPPPAATATTITGDTPDPSVSGSTVTVSFQVTSSGGGTPTGSVTVTVSGGPPTCTGNLSGGSGSCQLTLNGVGDRTLTATYSAAPGFAPSAGTAPHTVTPAPVPNEEPDADFNWDCEDLTCHFTDASEDDDGFIASRSWNFGDGSPPSGELNPSHTYAAADDYTVILTVTDNGGLTNSAQDEVDPEAPPSNEAPDADFNWNCDDLTCHFTDNSEDDDGFIASRSWNFGDGSPLSGELNPSHTYAAAGDYTVILTVTDNGGLTNSAQDVVDPEAPPPQVLEIDRQPSGSATVGEAFGQQPRIQLRAGGDDVETPGVTVSAEIASGGGTLAGTPTATTDGDGRAEFSNLSINGATGPHTLRFTATGFAEVTSNTIDVGKANTTTMITGDGDDPSDVGEAVTVQFQVVSSSGTPTGTVTVTADGGGSESCNATVAAGSCQITLLSPGNRTLTATYGGDDLFNISSANAAHTVTDPPPENQAPTAAFISFCDASLICTFTDASTDPDGDETITGWSWDFGDSGSAENTSVQQNSQHTYSVAGEYTVTLIVTDDDGAPSAPFPLTITVP